jgi:hypothetical protein
MIYLTLLLDSTVRPTTMRAELLLHPVATIDLTLGGDLADLVSVARELGHDTIAVPLADLAMADLVAWAEDDPAVLEYETVEFLGRAPDPDDA